MIASIIRRSVGAREWGERLSRRARRGARRGGGGERVPTDGPSVPVGRAHTLSRRARVGNQWAPGLVARARELASPVVARGTVPDPRAPVYVHPLSPISVSAIRIITSPPRQCGSTFETVTLTVQQSGARRICRLCSQDAGSQPRGETGRRATTGRCDGRRRLDAGARGGRGKGGAGATGGVCCSSVTHLTARRPLTRACNVLFC
jgi:hypothetical protein